MVTSIHDTAGLYAKLLNMYDIQCMYVATYLIRMYIIFQFRNIYEDLAHVIKSWKNSRPPVFRGAWEKDSRPGRLKMALGVRKCGSQTIITNTVQYACTEQHLPCRYVYYI